MDRTIRLYPWYQVAANAYFWMPVFFLFFSAHLPLRRVLELEAVYYLAIVLLEVPSGYFSDRVGRRPTLVIAALSGATAYVLFCTGDSFAVFAAAQVALAASMAFQSGTDASLHFDALHAAGRDAEYGAREARVARMASLSSAFASLVGGAVASLSLRGAYALTLAAALAQLGLALAMAEPPRGEGERAGGFVGQLGRCAAALRRGPLPWLFAFAVSAYALNHVPYHLAQPYTDLLLAPVGLDEGRLAAAPLALGVLTALIMVVRAAAAAVSIAVRNRLGLRGALLGSFGLQVLIIAACGAVLHPLVLGLLLLRSAPTGLQRAPLLAAIVPCLPRSLRATYLSAQSLAGRLLYSATLTGLAQLAVPGAALNWEAISRMALVAAGAGAIVLALLGVSARRVP